MNKNLWPQPEREHSRSILGFGYGCGLWCEPEF